MKKRNIIVIGASAGGLEALKKIVQNLPSGLEASIFIVWHMSPDVRGILPNILNKLNSIDTANAIDNEPIKPNHIYIAPPDHHLLIAEGHVRITRGPKENRFRPAIDPLFRSAAQAYGKRVIGVILSGGLDDGTAGLLRVKCDGGIAIVQDPSDAEISSMPESALREVRVDHCVPAAEIADLLVKLSSEEVDESAEVMKDEKTKIEINIAASANALKEGAMHLGSLSPYTCPECHGVLSRIKEGGLLRFRCHTGHAFSADTLLSALTEKVEESLYGAIRGMDECVLLLNHMGDHYAEANQPKVAAVYFKKAKEASDRSELVRKAVHNHELLSREMLLKDSDDAL